jgi:hypothetical protein
MLKWGGQNAEKNIQHPMVWKGRETGFGAREKSGHGDLMFRQGGPALRIEGLGKSGIGRELISEQPRAAGEA